MEMSVNVIDNEAVRECIYQGVGYIFLLDFEFNKNVDRSVDIEYKTGRLGIKFFSG